MFVISGVLVLVALALLVIGVAGPDLTFVYASIAVSLVSLGFLVAGVVQRRDQQDAPVDGSQPEPLPEHAPVEGDERAAGGSRRVSAAVDAGPRAVAEDVHAADAVEESVAESAVEHAVVAVPVVEELVEVPAHDDSQEKSEERAVEASSDEGDGASDPATAAVAVDARTDGPDGSPGEGASGERAAASSQVLVVAGRPRYHAADCRYLTGKDPEGIPLGAARARGFAPCGVCKPEDAEASAPQGSGEPEAGTGDGGLDHEQVDAGEAGRTGEPEAGHEDVPEQGADEIAAGDEQPVAVDANGADERGEYAIDDDDAGQALVGQQLAAEDLTADSLAAQDVLAVGLAAEDLPGGDVPAEALGAKGGAAVEGPVSEDPVAGPDVEVTPSGRRRRAGRTPAARGPRTPRGRTGGVAAVGPTTVASAAGGDPSDVARPLVSSEVGWPEEQPGVTAAPGAVRTAPLPELTTPSEPAAPEDGPAAGPRSEQRPPAVPADDATPDTASRAGDGGLTAAGPVPGTTGQGRRRTSTPSGRGPSAEARLRRAAAAKKAAKAAAADEVADAMAHSAAAAGGAGPAAREAASAVGRKPVKAGPGEAIPARTGAGRARPRKASPAKAGPVKSTPASARAAKAAPARATPAKAAPAKAIPAKTGAVRAVPTRTAPVRAAAKAGPVKAAAAPTSLAKRAAVRAVPAKAGGRAAVPPLVTAARPALARPATGGSAPAVKALRGPTRPAPATPRAKAPAAPPRQPAPLGAVARGGAVVVIPERDRFHRAECRFVRTAQDAVALSRSAAIRDGHSPCGVCKP